MESLLMSIQEHVSKYVEMVTTVFDVHVDISDNRLLRVAGTGRFNRMIGSPMLHNGNLFTKCMETGERIFVKDPETDQICRDCINRPVCKGQCEMGFPIKLDGEVLGVISIASSSPDQYETIMRSADKLTLFMENITDLIALKAREYQDQRLQVYNTKLREKLINLISDGVMILNDKNKILYMNNRCEKILDCNLAQIQYLTKIKQFAIVEKSGHKTDSADFMVRIRAKRIRLTGVIHNVNGVNEGEINKVFIFTDIKTLHENLTQSDMQQQYNFDYLIGESPSVLEAVSACKATAYSPNPVLLMGEPGSGKEMYARAIHNESIRRNNQFIRLTHGSAVEELIEKAVFDREQVQAGDVQVKNELLEGNTLYIDEVGDLSLANQVILLTVIQNSKFNNTKVICGSSKDLRQMSQKGEFKPELFYALEVYTVQIPPMRTRGRDILLFVDYYLEKCNADANKRITFSKEVRGMFLDYSWKGNIREIENVVSYVVEQMDSQATEVTAENMPPLILQRLRDDKKDAYNLANAEKELILKALNDFGNSSRSKSRVAKELGISNATLYRKLKQYRIQQNTLFE